MHCEEVYLNMTKYFFLNLHFIVRAAWGYCKLVELHPAKNMQFSVAETQTQPQTGATVCIWFFWTCLLFYTGLANIQLSPSVRILGHLKP
jgi:hypothetical protein